MSDTAFSSRVTKIVTAWAQAVNDWVYKGRNPVYVTSSGSVNAYVLTLPSVSLYDSITAGDTFTFKAHAANTSTATLQIVGSETITAKTLKLGGASLVGGEIGIGDVVTVTDDGTYYQIVGGPAFKRQLALSSGSSLVGFVQSGTAATTGTARDELRRTIWIEQFGATGDNSTDNSTAISNAVTYAKGFNNPTLKSAGGVFLMGSTVTIDFPCDIDFAGTFRPHGTFADFLFIFYGLVPGNEATNTDNLGFDAYWRDRFTFKQPLRVDGFKSDGSARQSKAIKFKQIDHGQLSFDVRWCVAQAVQFTGCRECDIWGGRILRSGGENSTTTDAPLYIYDESGVDDANNNLRFWGLNISDPNGAILYIGKNSGATGTPRRIEFHGAQLHRLDSTISGSTYAYQDTTAQNGTSIDIAQAQYVRFVGGNLRQSSRTGTLVKVGDTSASTAADLIKFIGVDLSADDTTNSTQLFDLQSVTTRISLIDSSFIISGSALRFSAGSNTAKVFTSFDTNYLDLTGSNAVVRVTPSASTSPVFSGAVSGDSVRRLAIDAAGKHAWSDGSTTSDTNLYRIAAGFVGTDNSYFAVKTYAQTENVQTSTSGAVTFVTGYNTMTLTENITGITVPASAQNGEEMTIQFRQSSGGSNTVAGWPAGVLLAGGAFTLTSTANKYDTLRFKWKKTVAKWIETARVQNC